jgi:hypothetical protein
MTELIMKKKKSTLTKPSKASKPTQKSQTVKPVKVKAPKVKPVKAQAKVHAQRQAQRQTRSRPQYNNADFKFATTGDNVGIHIFVTYQNQPIHKFTLPTADYIAWHRFQSPQKYEYVRMKVTPASFGNDQNLIYQVILTICNILDTLLDNAVRAQQAQQQRRM